MWRLEVILKSLYILALIGLFMVTWIKYSFAHEVDDLKPEGKILKRKMLWRARAWLLLFFIAVFVGGVLVGHYCQKCNPPPGKERSSE